ncbi:MAG: tRNA (guanosine(37)-N1)-methyltransferase TrmD [Candidatus Eisenbacteria bacterium]|nr:tRNA (guanosine(37)-N1)-methyltransferase TrmD [Candidatus Eisenbacteria bacterium]
MRIDVLTLFPEILEGPLSESIIKQARERGLLDIAVTNIRDHAKDKHRTADDYQYGGGSGMVMKPEPVFETVEAIGLDGEDEGTAVVLLSARGRAFDQDTAKELAGKERLGLICGRYKGVDERVAALATHELSIGDYVITGGELAAAVVIDAVARLVPGVLGDIESAETDSFYQGILGPPSYTRPESYRGMDVPEVLVSGHHELIRRWRLTEALRTTMERRPDLLEAANLTEEDEEILAELGWDTDPDD